MSDNLDELEVKEWRIRLRFLSDIVFATAMTIMILNLEIPDIGHINSTAELTKFLLKQLTNMGGFFIAFVTIAIYWMKHLEHFGVTLKVNQTFIWFQILFLAMIMLVPFWNAYVTNFPDNVAIKVFFSANLLLIGLFSYLSFNYATHPDHRLVIDTVSDETILTTKKQILAEPAIALVAAGLVFINPILWDISFIMIPVLFTLRKKLVKVKYFKFLKKSAV